MALKRRTSLSDASNSLWTLTAAQLRDQVASTDPIRGGGSVSIIAAALGVASIHKGIVVSLKKAGTDFARHQKLLDVSSRTAALLISLSELADADSRAFQSYLKACELPRTTECEKAARKIAREAGLVRATEVPLEAAAAMGRVLELAEAVAGLVDAHVRSEVLAGSVLLRASIRSVLFSVDANLSGISDAMLRGSLRVQRDELERTASLPVETNRSLV
jgi:formiminotetrahydrofolate cyclodeaminase